MFGMVMRRQTQASRRWADTADNSSIGRTMHDQAGEGVRTLDIDVGNVTLYQLSYARTATIVPDADALEQRKLSDAVTAFQLITSSANKKWFDPSCGEGCWTAHLRMSHLAARWVGQLGVSQKDRQLRERSRTAQTVCRPRFNINMPTPTNTIPHEAGAGRVTPGTTIERIVGSVEAPTNAGGVLGASRL